MQVRGPSLEEQLIKQFLAARQFLQPSHKFYLLQLQLLWFVRFAEQAAAEGFLEDREGRLVVFAHPQDLCQDLEGELLLEVVGTQDLLERNAYLLDQLLSEVGRFILRGLLDLARHEVGDHVDKDDVLVWLQGYLEACFDSFDDFHVLAVFLGGRWDEPVAVLEQEGGDYR